MPTPPLKVYKASAGSGKTFTLAVEYIKLLVNNPMSYRHILAVTFTNKATEEMKTRILSQLNGLAHGYADSQNYMDKITAEMGITQEQVQENAGIALKSLIHDYSSFRVETIDKFFQRVLKNLARELDLTANLRVELNDMQVEQLAVDSMIEQLNNEDQLLGWLMKYILENINDDKSWNIIGQVKKFGENIFKDTYKAHREHLTQILSDEHFFDRYRRQLHEIIQSNKDKMVAHAQHFFDVVEGYDAQDFAYNTSGIYGYFMKMLAGNFSGGEAGSRIKACMESSDKWCKKDSPKFVEITRLADSQLMDILRAAESDRADCYRLCKSAELTLSHLNQLRLLAYIEKMVRDLNNDANRFLLSDTQSMLNALIDDNGFGDMTTGIYGMSARRAQDSSKARIDFVYNGPENCTLKCLFSLHTGTTLATVNIPTLIAGPCFTIIYAKSLATTCNVSLCDIGVRGFHAYIYICASLCCSIHSIDELRTAIRVDAMITTMICD